VEDVLELVGNVVILGDLVEVLLESPEDLPDHCGRGQVVEPRGNEGLSLLLAEFRVDIVLRHRMGTLRWIMTFRSS
jgi:hypothetical protein